MQLSYNLIKSDSALEVSKKKIETNYVSKVEVVEENKEKDMKSIEAEIRKSYESLGASIIKKAKREAEALLMKSRKTAVEIEKTSYEEGYAQGKENGFEDGYKEGLQKAKLETEEKVKRNIKKSEKILESANNEYREYLKLKEKDIINIAFEMASIIVRKEFQQPESILPLLEEVLNEAKGEENIIIKCNTVHVKAIEDKVDYFKKVYAIKGEIFIIEDPLMENGNAIVEKNTGKAIIGLDIGLEKLEEALFK
ncbi:FliH/SctL family protein [Clostridium tertium]|uniref:FliH/SctL family protein n=1 Tax=Clostridium tertium TaxID=1559 RepID=UPI0024B38A48|nr:FliH/SctL family protein [Clostridium tertium]MDI9219180.1 flagellar biosynthesis/type III secretory pathway-like protein [Clostridium tertium]